MSLNKPLSEERASFSLATADFWFSHYGVDREVNVTKTSCFMHT